MRGVAALVRRHIRRVDGIGRGEDVAADFTPISPVVGLRVLRRLLGVTRRQQPHRELVGERALDDRRRTGQKQDLFGLVARVVDHGHAGAGEAKAARPGIVTTAVSRLPVAFPPRAARTPLSMLSVIGVSSRGMASAAEWMKAASLNLS